MTEDEKLDVENLIVKTINEVRNLPREELFTFSNLFPN